MRLTSPIVRGRELQNMRKIPGKTGKPVTLQALEIKLKQAFLSTTALLTAAVFIVAAFTLHSGAHNAFGETRHPKNRLATPLESSSPFYNKALIYHRNDRLPEAVRLYKKVLRFDPGHEKATLNCAAALILLGKYLEAQRLLKQLESSPSRPRGVLLNLAIAATGLGKPDQALDYLNKAFSNEDASQWEINYHRAVAYAKLDRLPEALTLYQKALEDRPDDAFVLFNLAVTCDTMGLYPKALTHYKAILQTPSPDINTKTIHKRIRVIGTYLKNNQYPTKRQ